jgi:hypothetical protein
MNFNRSSHRDDWLFVIALLLPTVFGGARYVESNRQMDQIARGHPQESLAAVDGPGQARVHVAYAQSQGR